MSHQPSKKLKPDESGELELASASNTPSSSPIFRLNVDCLEEIFDLLSLKELHAIGQTCKRMQSVAGYFFKQNYSHDCIECKTDGIISCYSDKISGFIRFIRRIDISGYNPLFSSCNFTETFHYIESNSFDSLKYIIFKYVEFCNEDIAYAEKTLGKIKGMTVRGCSLNGDLYEKILKFCPNLKMLNIRIRYGTNHGKVIGNGNNWLLREYPNLEHFGLLILPHWIEIKEIKIFLKNNSSIKTFETNINFILLHKQSILEANIKLDTLTIDDSPYRMNAEFIGIINELREKGIFKKLIFSTADYIQEEVALQPLTELKELDIYFENARDPFGANKSINAKFPNHIRKITLTSILFDHILAIVQFSPSITEIVVKSVLDYKGMFERMGELNNERKKLADAQKIVIYVFDHLYLGLKQAGVNTEQSLVQIKRNTLDANTRSYFLY